MTINNRNKLASARFKKCLEVLMAKGRDYSGEGDCLNNFKQTARDLGMSKYQVWAIFFQKHIHSVLNSIKRSPEKPQVESEPLEERITDIINYAIILEALLDEDKDVQKISVHQKSYEKGYFDGYNACKRGEPAG